MTVTFDINNNLLHPETGNIMTIDEIAKALLLGTNDALLYFYKIRGNK